jgi:hypothetical protein
VLFPPLSCLEVIGEPRVEDDVVVFPLRANVCLKGLTLEQLVARRKTLHLATVANLREELRHAVRMLLEARYIILYYIYIYNIYGLGL